MPADEAPVAASRSWLMSMPFEDDELPSSVLSAESELIEVDLFPVRLEASLHPPGMHQSQGHSKTGAFGITLSAHSP